MNFVSPIGVHTPHRVGTVRGVLFCAKSKCAVFYSECQNETPRQVPTRCGVWTPIAREI